MKTTPKRNDSRPITSRFVRILQGLLLLVCCGWIACAFPEYKRCNDDSQCVEDNGSSRYYCHTPTDGTSFCKLKCNNKDDCNGEEKCSQSGKCIECEDNGDCDQSEWCKDGACTPNDNSCEDNGDCRDGHTCGDGKKCIKDENCSQDTDCAQNEWCKESACVENKCDPACKSSQKCVHSQCQPQGCSTDADCKDAARPVCDKGTCIAKDPLHCEADQDCLRNERCIKSNNRCAFLSCTPSNPDSCAQSFGTKMSCAKGICRFQCVSDDNCKANETCVDGECRDAVRNCNDDENCSQGERCIASKCIPPKTCNTDNDCTVAAKYCLDGVCSVVRCTKDTHCAVTEMCQNNDCVAKAMTCTGSSDCQPFEDCIQSTCQPKTCKDDADCPKTHLCDVGTCLMLPGICRTRLDCRSDQVCDQNDKCVNETCTPACDTKTQVCVAGVCETRCKSESDCSNGQLCRLGLCADECHEDKHCPGCKICNSSTKTCITCTSGQCKTGTCNAGQCKEPCDPPCKFGEACVQDPNNTGSYICETKTSCTQSTECIQKHYCDKGTCAATTPDVCDDTRCPTPTKGCMYGKCVSCITDGDCQPTLSFCRSGKCQQSCTTDTDCDANERCIRGACTDAHDGCTTPCQPDEVCQGGKCTLVACGAETNAEACGAIAPGLVCKGGLCRYACSSSTQSEIDCTKSGGTCQGGVCLYQRRCVNNEHCGKCSTTPLCFQGLCGKIECTASSGCGPGQKCQIGLCVPN